MSDQPYIGKLEIGITPNTITLPAAMEDVDITRNDAFAAYPYVTSAPSSSLGPSRTYTYVFQENGGSLTFSGMVVGPATTELSKKNIYDMIIAITQDEIPTITITSTIDTSLVSIFKDCRCVSSGIQTRSDNGCIVFEGPVVYKFSYMA